MVKEKKGKKSASQKGFVVAEGLSGIRLNASLYLGELGDDMAFRIIKEEVDNAYDEAVAGRNKLIEVVVDLDRDFHIVADAAGGIPTDKVKLKGGKSETIMTAAFTRTHAGGKFNDEAYKTSAGTHGVGVAAVNAVCSSLRVWSTYKGKLVRQEFSKGEIVSGADPERVKALDDDVARRLHKPVKHYGTIIAGKIDQDVVSADSKRGKKLPKNYRHANPPVARIAEWLEYVALLQPGLTIRFTVIKDRKKKTEEFVNKKDLGWIPKFLCDKSELSVMGKPLTFRSDFISMAVQWSDHPDTDKFMSFVNTSPTADGGWHVVGFTSALATALKPYMPATKGRGRALGFSTSDMLIGLVGMFDFRMHGASYTSQVKDKLASRVDKEVSDVLTPVLEEYFKANQRVAKAIIKRAQAMNKGREELAAVVKSMASVKKNARGSSMPSSLALSDGAKPHERELYVVEGDSAAGCFIGTTPVLLDSGETITFEEMAERTLKGEVFHGPSFNIETQSFETHEFVQPRLTKWVDELVEIEVDDGNKFQCTANHPWLVSGKDYVAAEDLMWGFELTTPEGNKYVERVRKIKLDNVVPVYDATMPVHHNFCLGNGVVVHNTAIDSRNATYQEVLPAGGKPLNALKASLAKVLAHEEIQNLLIALGADVKSLDPKAENPKLDANKLRVGKLVLLVDSDADGGHIAVLYLAAIYRLLPDMFRLGMVYCVKPVLYAVVHEGKLYGGMTFNECREKAPKAVKDSQIVRIKGWGEVDETFLEPIAFDPTQRELIQINPFASIEQERWFRGVVAEDAVHRRRLLGLED